MDRATAESILKGISPDIIQEGGGLFCLGPYISWVPGDDITIDAELSLPELLAITWWTQNNDN